MFNWFKNMSIVFKLFVIFGILLLGSLIINAQVNYVLSSQNIEEMTENNLITIKDNVFKIVEVYVENTIKTHLNSIADKNRDIVKMFYERFKNGEMSEAEAKLKASEVLLSQKIGTTGYNFVWYVEEAPEVIPLAVHPQLTGVDVAKYDFVQEAVSLKDGYIEYKWKNPDDETERDKAMAFVYFKEWEWVIATSSYKEEFNYLIDKNNIREDILTIKIGNSDFPYIIDSNGEIVLHPELEGKNIYNATDENDNFYIQEIIDKKNGKVRYLSSSNGGSGDKNNDGNRWKLAYFGYLEKMDWYVIVEIYEDEMYETLYQQGLLAILIVTISILILIPLILLVSRIITKPLKKVSMMLKDISEGKGDLTKRIGLSSKDEIGMLSKYFDVFVASLNNMVKQIKISIEQINSGTNQIAESNQVLSDGSAKQAASIEEVTASTTQISAIIQSNLENTISANKILNNTRDLAEDGNNKMMKLRKAMETISNSAVDIKRIISIIDDISFQTNLLAINADIESARVGKYGRGFAVVANSVRNLANKSAKSVKDTTEKIEEVIKNIESGNELTKITADKLEEITSSTQKSAQIINELTDSSREQANGVEQISKGLIHIEEVVQSNNATAEETAAASEQLVSQIDSVRELISYFKVDEDTSIIETKQIKPS